MKAVIQRVTAGNVSIDGNSIASIEKGLVILVGIGHTDGSPQVQAMAEKIANLRIFEDDAGKMNRSLLEAGGSALVVSQFTLYADTRKGRRPAFTNAAAPEIACRLVDEFARALGEIGVPTCSGEFGAHMIVQIVNDGPVTIVLEI
jgi:D-tyrosyl-tRNA(Tyr) deacylase